MSDKNKLKGGKGDNLKSSNVNQKELQKGIKVEMEHTNDKNLAKEIALDHLAENPNYYSLLSTIHTESKKLTKKEFAIKFITEKIEKLSGKKIMLEDEDSYAQFLLNKKNQAAEKKKALIQQAIANGAVGIEKLKKNDIFTFPGGKSEYYFDGYNRSTGKFAYHRADDINAFGEKKKGTLVLIENAKKRIIEGSTIRDGQVVRMDLNEREVSEILSHIDTALKIANTARIKEIKSGGDGKNYSLIHDQLGKLRIYFS